LHPRRLLSIGSAIAVALAIASSATAQQRPLVTEDPEAIGAGRILLEGGFDFAYDQEYTVSGLEGNLMRLPTLGLSFGISSIAEVQIDGGLFNHLSITRSYPAPLSDLLTVTGDSTHDIEDLVVATKIRLKAEGADSPSLGLRFATRLPNASNESGLGLDTTDFSTSFLIAKTTQSIRVVGNIGFAFLSDPTDGQRQNDVLTYGFSLARAMTDRAELVGEINGRASIRAGQATAGTESRSLLTIGGRYTWGYFRLDGGVFIGLTPIDPTIGFTTGFTYVFNGFEVP
jgi:hypothetical protein